MGERYLHTADVSRRTNIPEATLRYWRHCGTGPPSFRLGPRRVVYPESELHAWIEAQAERDGLHAGGPVSADAG